MITVAYFWRINPATILWALFHMGWDRWWLRRTEYISFWKLLGTGKGETFTLRDGTALRWGFIVVIPREKLDTFDASPVVSRWRKKSHSEFHAVLAPISVHGKWAKRNPFISEGVVSHKENWSGEVVAITRARIKWRKNLIFWRSVPPVTQSLHQSEGLIGAIGIGEAPIGLQGTFSLWRSSEAVKNFAYRGSAHQSAIAATHREKWYAEELFARFAVLQRAGRL